MSLLLGALGEFVSLTGRVLPYFLLGAAAGAIVQTFGSRWAERLFARDRRTSLPTAVAAAALLPGCSCATMPMAAGMQRSGGPTRGVLASFIFVSPLLSPVTVVLTWSLLGWRMTVARVIVSLVGGLTIGYLIDRFERWFDERSPESSDQPLPIAGGAENACDDDCQTESSGRTLDAWKSFLRILRSVSPYFLLGMAAAAALSTFVPEGAVPQLLGSSAGPAAFLLAAAIGLPLYVCEGEEVPITFCAPSCRSRSGTCVHVSRRLGGNVRPDDPDVPQDRRYTRDGLLRCLVDRLRDRNGRPVPALGLAGAEGRCSLHLGAGQPSIRRQSVRECKLRSVFKKSGV